MSPHAAKSSALPLVVLCLALLAPTALALGCSGNGGTPAGGGVEGSFVVSLVSDFPPAHALIRGSAANAPANQLVIWDQLAKEGGCLLQKPRIPFCSTPCGSGLECVEDDTCKEPPEAIDVGTVTIAGIKTAAGGSEVVLDSTKTGTYGTATSLAYPPFDEGADVSASGAGSALGMYTAHAKGIAPLVVPMTDVPLEKDKPLVLTWTPKGAAGDSTIHVHLDISHHGGSKGQIECDVPDNGSLTIGAPMATQLVNLGVSGFPTVRLSRRTSGSAAVGSGTVTMRAEHDVERAIVVPGHINCTENEQCPVGQTCQDDLQCK